MKKKGKPITKGPGGKEVKLPKNHKHVQVIRSIVLTLFKEMVFDQETVDNEKFSVVFHDHLLQKLEAIGERDPLSKINQMITHGFLVLRNQNPGEDEPISYYIFKYKTRGLKFRRQYAA